MLVPADPDRTVVSDPLVELVPELELGPDVVEVAPPDPAEVVAVVALGGGGGGAATSTVASDEGADRTPSDWVAPLRMAKTRYRHAPGPGLSVTVLDDATTTPSFTVA